MSGTVRAKDTLQIVRLRKLTCDQSNIPGITQATAWRIEHGKACKRDTALTYHSALQTEVPFEELFEVADERDNFGWAQVDEAARRVGGYLFGTFRATAVITYSGPSAIFASLVMARALSTETGLLTTPVYLGMHMDRSVCEKARPARGFVVLKEKPHQRATDQCVVFVPKALEIDDPKKNYRIAIIDDLIMTGRPLRLLKDYLLLERGYRPDRVEIGCCVCHTMTLARRDETTPAEGAFGFSTNVVPGREHVRFPWGAGIFFPRPRTK
jgi:hypothetical protein